MSVAKSLKEIKDLLDQSNLSQQDRIRFEEKIRDLSQISADTTKERLNLEKDINNALIVQNRYYNDLYKELQNITAELDNQFKAHNQMTKGLRGLTAQANKLANEEDNITTLNKKQLLSIHEKIKAEGKRTKQNAIELTNKHKMMGLDDQDFAKRLKHLQTLDKSKGGIDKKEADALVTARGMIEDNFSVIQRQLEASQDRIDLEDKFNKKLGFGGKLAEGLDKALQKAGLPSIGIADAIEKAKKNFIATNGKSSVFKDTLKGVASNLKDAMSFANLMQAGFTMLVKTVMEVDKASGEFAKNNGISYQNALAIRGEMNEIARSSNDVVVSSKALMETQGTLNKFFGQSTKFTGKLAEDMTSIAKRTGLSEEAQGVFALEAMKTGKGAKDILQNQTLTVMEMNKQKGLQMSVKQVQEAISKTSNAVFMTFKGSTEELTKQVMSVKALGANMEQVEGIASSLLDFESSIQSELEAELLLGKQINLEKAREAALRGDMGKVAEEVMKNDAIMNAFATDNVIQQEAAAKALGMNREQLAGMIKEQEKLEAVRAAGFDSMNDAQKEYNKMRADGLSKEAAAAAIGDDNLAAQLESVSAAEKFEGTMARIQELFVALAEPILAIVTPIADIMVPALNFVSDILTGIKDMISAIFDPTKSLSETFQEMGPVVSFIAAGLTAAGVAITAQMVPGLIRAAAAALTALPALISGAIAAVTSASAATLGIGAIAIAAGIAAVIASMSSATSQAQSKMNDGMIGPDGGMIVSGPKGSIQLNKEDSIIAGTDLMGEKSGNKERGGGARRDAALIAEVRTLIDVSRQILAKNTTLVLDGEVLATTTTDRQMKDKRKAQ